MFMQMIKKIESMSDDMLLAVWNALFPVEDWHEVMPEGITIEDWAQLLYSELSKRGISAV